LTTLSEISKLIKDANSVAIFFHVRPDGDSVGSGLALYRAIKSMGKRVGVHCADTVPTRFSFLPDFKEIKRKLDNKYDLFISLDCADVERMGELSYDFATFKNTVNIDHHISNPRYAKYNYVVDTASNCENVYALIKELNITPDKQTADLLLMGLLTDTGGLKHRNVKEETLIVASQLVKLGGDITDLSYKMFTAQSKERAKLFGKVMSDIKYYLNDRLAIATVFKRDLDLTNAKREETEGFIDFVMGIEGVEVGICLTEMENGSFKASMRSKSADVSKVAGEFGGGGHVLASGCQLFTDYYDVIDKLTFTVSKYLED